MIYFYKHIYKYIKEDVHMKLNIFAAALAVCLLLSGCAAGETGRTEAAVSSPLEAVLALAPGDVTSITYSRYTEGGAVSGSVNDAESISDICQCLSGIALGEKSSVGTTDDGLHLIVNTADETHSLYFEGNNLVIDGKQYSTEGLGLLKKYIDMVIRTEAEDISEPEATQPPVTQTAKPRAAQTVQINSFENWYRYSNYAYEANGRVKYWLEFEDDFYLHCMFISGDPEYYQRVYTLYPDWENTTAQQLTIRRVVDEDGTELTSGFESMVFLFSSDDVIMQVTRDESTLAGGAGDNILTGEYTFRPREQKTPEQLCVMAQEYYERSFGYYPPEAIRTENGNGTITIQLFDIVTMNDGDSHTATSAWYTVDAYGIGTDDLSGKTVDLSH